MPYNKLLTNRACSGCTGEYWPSVVFVRTSLRSVRTVTTSDQYSPVRPPRSVSKRLVSHQLNLRLKFLGANFPVSQSHLFYGLSSEGVFFLAFLPVSETETSQMELLEVAFPSIPSRSARAKFIVFLLLLPRSPSDKFNSSPERFLFKKKKVIFQKDSLHNIQLNSHSN